jgi:hypothetical protein
MDLGMMSHKQKRNITKVFRIIFPVLHTSDKFIKKLSPTKLIYKVCIEWFKPEPAFYDSCAIIIELPILFSLFVFFFHSFNISADESPLFLSHNSKIACTSCWTFLICMQPSYFSQYPKFVLWCLNWDGREVAWLMYVSVWQADHQ